MTNDKLPPFQKFLASIFFVLFVASLVFMGHRIMTKSEYERREAEQCRILAVSAADAFIGFVAASPDITDKLASGDILLIIDHKLIPGNWNISVTAKRGGAGLAVETTVKSGWNTRSPQEYTCRAKAFDDGAAFSDAKDKRTAEAVREVVPAKRDKRLLFAYPDERLECPVKLEVRASKLKLPDFEKPFLVLAAER